jgi:mRNA-degrading endonuclease RelE of RelBE toxin-antitoxin system
MFEIEFTQAAWDDLATLKKSEQRLVVEAIETQLKHEPVKQTRNRKPMRPDPIAAWELRAGKFRVFYNVDEAAQTVCIEAIGFKLGNLLFIRKQRREL